MGISQELRDGLVANIPVLRAFAFSLCGNASRADDLVQETMVKAWANFDSFKEGTNLRAWLFTILRNEFYSQMRKAGREVEDAEGQIAERQPVAGNQESHLELKELKRALTELPADQREAIILVGASGMTYDEAARICGVATGTMKSRVSRARARLVDLLGDDGAVVSAADIASVNVA